MAKPNELMEAFVNIREGIALFLKKEFGLTDEAIGNTFSYLISQEEIPERSKEDCEKIIDAIKNNQEVLDIFLLGMRIKTTLTGKQGMSMEAMGLRLHLAELGMNISEALPQELPSPDEFITLASEFYEKFKSTYS